jgi:hypothetical protein
MSGIANVANLAAAEADLMLNGTTTIFTVNDTTGRIILPAKSVIDEIILNETAGNAVTGLIIGTSSGGSQVLATTAVSASAAAKIQSALVQSTFLVATPIYVQASNWNSASVSVTVFYRLFG